ncbi:MAG: hypothetical protein MZW92_22235 [Comamonadaceae bacterium]|nr:hypothetical protein [Comamonadaceae bacterium]
MRHADVENHDIRLQVRRQPDRIEAVPRLGHHLPPRLLFEDAPETLAHQRMVVGQQDPDHGRPPESASPTVSSVGLALARPGGGAPAGSSTVMRAPRPGALRSGTSPGRP